MALPAFLKSPYIMGSAGVVGIGGVSAVALSSGGGGGIDYSESIRKSEISRENLINDLSTVGQLGTKCVKEFFGAEKIFSFSDAGFSTDDSFHAPEKPTVSEPKGDTKGCSYVQFSSKDEEAFIFQTETTVKNDKVGLALFSSGRNVGYGGTKKLVSKTNHVVMYYLFFLEKEQDDWKVKGGYSWADINFAWGFSNKHLRLKSPSGNINFNDKWLGIKEEIEYVDKEWQHKMYYGSWTGNGSSGQEVFAGIELWGNGEGSAEILGRDYSQTFDGTKSGKGYGDVGTNVEKYEYKVSENKWHKRQQLTVSTLDNWYKPFRGKKGNWVEQSITRS